MLDSEIQEREELYKMFNVRHVLKEKERPLTTIIKERLEDFKYDYIDKPIIYPVKNVFRGLTNLVIYAKLIYRDRDWDYCYLYEMMEFKLKRMRKHVETCYVGHTKKELRRLKTCELLLGRLVKDEYWPFNEHDCRNCNDQQLIRKFNHEEYLRKQDLELLAKYIVKYSRTWWC